MLINQHAFIYYNPIMGIIPPTFKFLIFSVILALGHAQFPKIVWTYWENDIYQTDPLHISFHLNHKKWVKDGWELRLLNAQTIKPYLEKIPYYQGDFDNLDYVQLAHKADYVRILLLSYYGGVYLDFTSFFIEDLSWLEFDNLRNNPDVRNKYGDESDVLFFTFPDYGSLQTYFQPSLNQTFQISTGYEIWFIAAKPNSTFLLQYCAALRQGFIDGVVTAEGQAKYLNKIIEEEKIQLRFLGGSFYLSSLQLLQIQIQRKQHQFDKISKQNNSPRRLAVWHYKIWHIQSIKGPYSILLSAYPNPIIYITKLSIEKLKILFKLDSIRYLFKIPGMNRNALYQYLNIKRNNKWGQFYNKTCPRRFSIQRQSVVYKYLIEGTPYEDNFTVTPIGQRVSLALAAFRCRSQILQTVQKTQKTLKITLIVVIPLAVILIVLTLVTLVKRSKVLKFVKNSNVNDTSTFEASQMKAQVKTQTVTESKM